MKKLPFTYEIQLDTASILPSSLLVYCGANKLTSSNEKQIDFDYEFNSLTNKIRFVTFCSDSIVIFYECLFFDFNKRYFLRDTSLLYRANKGRMDDFKIEDNSETNSLFETGSLKKSGTISRGINFGNRQDLAVNSTLNLQISGYLSPELQVLASVTDNNLPIQPEGNTSKIQEFDQVFVQLFNKEFKLIAGDFWLYKPQGYFLNYRKRGQGLSGDYFWRNDQKTKIKTQLSGAFSKGKFNRQLIQGVEGNQGPYRLIGENNEPFIIVLSGTERVFIDGKELNRGQENDYLIDYNTSEVRFTAKNMITKDSRIAIEFQYTDQNYARSLFQFSHEASYQKGAWWFNAYSEQDAKNQSLQQQLTDPQKFLLSQIGDQLSNARISSIDSTGYQENIVMYALIDSLGIDSVLLFSTNLNTALYTAQFTYLGKNNGNYLFDQFTGLGRVYKWIAPIAGVPQGDFEPVRILSAPKQQQLFNLGGKIKLTKQIEFSSEFASSKNDANSFSNLDKKNDFGFSNRTKIMHSKPFGKDSISKWTWNNSLEGEFLDPHFKPIEQYRAVEFDRDWNTRGQNFTGNQIIAIGETGLKHYKMGTLGIQGQYFKIGKDLIGQRAVSKINWKTKSWEVRGDGSFLNTRGKQNTQFLRHRLQIVKHLGRFQLGYQADQEKNGFNLNDTLSNSSYSFFDWQGSMAFGDTVSGTFKLVYRERYDGRVKTNAFSRAAKAQTYSMEWKQLAWKRQRITLIASQRILQIIDSNLIDANPEQTSTGRFDHEFKSNKQFIQLNTFYEVGSGLELKKEFIYIQVNDGQGVYTWVDYNLDNVKDLNEFEVAQFADQASYIRVFTPSNSYVRTFSNEFNQSLQLRPDRVWNSKKGIKKIVSKFSTLSRVRIQRKTNNFKGFASYNPFDSRLETETLISLSSINRHSLFFNRNGTDFGADYSFEQSESKQLLATGFDAKSKRSNELNTRVNFGKNFQLLTHSELGEKKSFVDYTSGRNYQINYWQFKPSFVYQPNTFIRIGIETRFSEKKNSPAFGGEQAKIQQFGILTKFNQAEKGSFQSDFSYVKINYVANANSPLGFEMLEALKPGNNFIWNLNYQRTISKNLQLTFQYNGRKSDSSPMIHAGGMELKAFF